MTTGAERNENAGTAGIVLHSSAGYDLLLWLLTRGREAAFREKMLRPARLQPGETVLDIGCGTGTLTIAAKRQVGPTGVVCGVDASPEMIARAEKKARRLGVDVSFKKAFAQSLPFPATHFDVVLTTVMLHHLPNKARREMGKEIRRIVKPGGRALAVDFTRTRPSGKGIFDRLHRRHGDIDSEEMVDVLRSAGMRIAESGAVGMRDLYFVVATAPYV